MPTRPNRRPQGQSVHGAGAAMVERTGLADADAVVGVAAYSADRQTVLYRDDDATGEYSPDSIHEILDQIRLETIGVGAVESLHGPDLRAFARLYDGLNTVVVPTGEATGLVVAHDPAGEECLEAVVSTVEDGLTAALDER
ncbi:MAG: hypothetical protein ABEJ88_07375 [Halobacterium sp.]